MENAITVARDAHLKGISHYSTEGEMEMKKLLEKYPPEDLANLNAYGFLAALIILVAEIVKVIL